MHRSSVYTKHKTENVGLETSVGKSENFNFIPVAQICNMYNTCGYLSFFHKLNINLMLSRYGIEECYVTLFFSVFA